ncbi:tRNA (adenine(22)-N(1))-methyltransferase TrmK [Paenibacillus sp. JX-17]|uniref:tRNA (Adenine(22)-N(1))-methyltransferase TrmK n=1 Tax=Paenibacillus lacisoli TaxID=3064525 RepID=A0ABT9CBU1_9BACL|nr:tRNA (adenine(22)-N(1))-methyltransferase TrmK [Paenibacillus sp. JX-17]MDO7905442.1 tRNA (adenine(22)-N(1))-methyltransferase TrmK [Paenibacillus sp. JX-17]
MKLSQRLQRIMEQIPAGSKLADIGSDHALLPVAAIQSGTVVRAVAGEVNTGPYEAALKQVAAAGLQNSIQVRKGDGLEVVQPGEVDVITIAGMGGALIASILDRGLDKLEGVQQLVLQPNVGEDILRSWLIEHDWVLVHEQILEEDGKIYEILTAIPAAVSPLAQEELYRPRPLQENVILTRELLIAMGPYLVDRPNAVFHTKWREEIGKLQGIIAQLSRSDLDSAREKADEIRERIQRIEEVLLCLQKDRP